MKFRAAFVSLVLVCGLLFVPALCQDHQGIEHEIEHLNQLYAKFVRDELCGGIINLYHPGFTLVLYDGEITKGLDAIKLTLSALETVASFNITSLSVSALGTAGRVIFQHAKETARDGEGNILYIGESFRIWKRTDEGLKISMEIYDLGEWTMRENGVRAAKTLGVDTKAEIDYLTGLYSEYTRNKQCAKFVGMFHSDFMMVFFDGTTLTGLKGIQFALTFVDGVNDLNMTSLTVSPLGTNGRFVYQHAMVTPTDREGNVMTVGDAFLIWKRQPGGLELYLEIFDE